MAAQTTTDPTITNHGWRSAVIAVNAPFLVVGKIPKNQPSMVPELRSPREVGTCERDQGDEHHTDLDLDRGRLLPRRHVLTGTRIHPRDRTGRPPGGGTGPLGVARPGR